MLTRILISSITLFMLLGCSTVMAQPSWQEQLARSNEIRQKEDQVAQVGNNIRQMFGEVQRNLQDTNALINEVSRMVAERDCISLSFAIRNIQQDAYTSETDKAAIITKLRTNPRWQNCPQ